MYLNYYSTSFFILSRGLFLSGSHSDSHRSTCRGKYLTRSTREGLNDHFFYCFRLNVYYPPQVQITSAIVDFESFDNFISFINTTTPFTAIPYFALRVIALTNS